MLKKSPPINKLRGKKMEEKSIYFLEDRLLGNGYQKNKDFLLFKNIDTNLLIINMYYLYLKKNKEKLIKLLFYNILIFIIKIEIEKKTPFLNLVI